MSTNPFEPPRTTDLEAPIGPGVDGAGRLPDEAIDELVATGPWVRRLARVTVFAIVVQLLGIVANLARPMAVGGAVGALFGGLLSVAISARFLAILRRYAAVSDDLRRGAPDAAGQVVVSQASYFRWAGMLLAIMGSLLVFALLVGVAVGALSRGRP